MNIECRKVQTLMSLYIDDALSYKLKMFVYNHLLKCKICMEKYRQLKKTMLALRNNFKKISEKLGNNVVFSAIEYEKFKENLSAYFDTELSGQDILKFKNYMQKVKYAKDTYASFASLNTHIHKYLQYNLPVLKVDFSKKITQNIKKKTQDKGYLEIILTFLFVIFIVISVIIAENYFIPELSVKNQMTIKISKIKENIKKFKFQKFR